MPNISVVITNPLDRENTIDVTVCFDTTPAEPDVGIMSWGIEDVNIESIDQENSGFEKPLDLEKVMTEKDWSDLEEQIHSKYDPNDTYDESDYMDDEARDR